MANSDLLSIKQVAALCGLSRATLYHLRRTGEGPAYYEIASKNVNRKRPLVRYRVIDVMSWRDEARVDPVAGE